LPIQRAGGQRWQAEVIGQNTSRLPVLSLKRMRRRCSE
jgi:hypothetical protein